EAEVGVERVRPCRVLDEVEVEVALDVLPAVVPGPRDADLPVGALVVLDEEEVEADVELAVDGARGHRDERLDLARVELRDLQRALLLRLVGDAALDEQAGADAPHAQAGVPLEELAELALDELRRAGEDVDDPVDLGAVVLDEQERGRTGALAD